jgi:hypothetical protein
MKTITTLLFTTSLLISSAASANQSASIQDNVQINLGGVYTHLHDMNLEGFKAAAKINFPHTSDSLGFYGKVSYQSSHDNKQGKNFYFDENELVLGIQYHISNDHSVFFEGGDIKQNFEQGNNSEWKDYFSVARLGTQLQQSNYNIQFALEQRGGINDAFGYSTSIAFFDSSMRISYTDVGRYESIGFSFQSKF